MSIKTDIPCLLPSESIYKPKENIREWTPSKYREPPQPPPIDEAKQQEELLANARLMADGTRVLKKTRPRRTVDFNGGYGRWTLMRKLRPNSTYVPYMRPCLPNIIDLLPPKAYPENASTSLCTKYVHTSTNKIRCPVNVVVWTPEGRRVLTGSTSGEFTLWNGLTFNFETILQAHDSAICALKFNHSGAYIASADKTGVIKYFEPNMNNLTAWQGSASREAIRGISFSPDDARFVTASDDSSVRIWNFQESRIESVLTGHGWDVKCVDWHPTKGLLVSGSKDSMVKFWDPRTGTCLSTLHQHKNTVQALSWSPNGHYVASASRDQTIRVFDIRAMKEYRILKGHKKEVCSVTWHPVHSILVSGGSEGSILHWDLSTHPEQKDILPPQNLSPSSTTDADLFQAILPTPTSTARATLSQAHDSNVWSLAFHPLGHILASGSNDHTTRFWSRERPGDTTSVFSGGGEKPVVSAEEEQEDEQDMKQYEEEGGMVPGFVGAWDQTSTLPFKKEDVITPAAFNLSSISASLPGFVASASTKNEDDFIPGFGGDYAAPGAPAASNSMVSQNRGGRNGVFEESYNNTGARQASNQSHNAYNATQSQQYASQYTNGDGNNYSSDRYGGGNERSSSHDRYAGGSAAGNRYGGGGGDRYDRNTVPERFGSTDRYDDSYRDRYDDVPRFGGGGRDEFGRDMEFGGGGGYTRERESYGRDRDGRGSRRGGRSRGRY